MPKNKRCILVLLAGVLIIMWLWWSNVRLEINRVTVVNERLPESFDGFRIAHISDLHNASFGKNNDRLIAKLKKEKPDVVFITGDLVDELHGEYSPALALTRQSCKYWPVYYVTGNHEARLDNWDVFAQKLQTHGVCILDDQKVLLERDGEIIAVEGLREYGFSTKVWTAEEAADKALTKLDKDSSFFTLLLSHRPELMPIYKKHRVDVVFAGHNHGGQLRLPFIGGLLAPGCTLFPKYDAGVFTEDRTTMIVSRGLGNSVIPIRFANSPEIVIVELKKEQYKIPLSDVLTRDGHENTLQKGV